MSRARIESNWNVGVRPLACLSALAAAAVCLWALPAHSEAQQITFTSSTFNDPGWHYMLSMTVYPVGQRTPTLDIYAEVPPHDRARTARVMWFAPNLEPSVGDTVIIGSQAGELATPAETLPDASALVFDVPIDRLRELTAPRGRMSLSAGAGRQPLTTRTVVELDRYLRAAVNPDDLAAIAYGPGASAQDLRPERDLSAEIEELAAFHIKYDRFEDRYTFEVGPFPAEVYRGADSVRVGAFYTVGADEYVGFGFRVFGAEQIGSSARMRMEGLPASHGVHDLEEVHRVPIEGGEHIGFMAERVVTALILVANPTDVRLGREVELAMPPIFRRVLGLADRLASDPENVKAFARDVYGCEDLTEMARRGEVCRLTPERLGELLDGSSDDEGGTGG